MRERKTERRASRIPDWEVRFQGNFWPEKQRERPGQEIPLNKSFDWEGQEGRMPALYLCGKGLVIDLCWRVSPERIRAHWEKRSRKEAGWAEDPLRIRVGVKALWLNGRQLRWAHGSGVVWDPCRSEERDRDLEARSAVEHYGLDPAWGWSIQRLCFPWATRRKPQLKSLRLILEQEPVELPGPCFWTSRSGEQFRFSHPSTGVEHTLTVEDYRLQVLPELGERLAGTPLAGCELPRHCVTMTVSLTPELDPEAFLIRDSAPGDQPRRKNGARPPESGQAETVGIIGGAVGTTTIVLGGRTRAPGRYQVSSSTYFQAPEKVKWSLVFREKTKEDLTLEWSGEEKR